ncbi:MAG: FAD-dependent oxidoreductase, partial [Myxococcota bacterium]
YASQRGHFVTLIEKQNELDGFFRLACDLFPPNRIFLDSLLGQLKALPIDLKLGEEATTELISKLVPEAIIVATGGRFESPRLPGDEADHVIRGKAVVEWISQNRDELDERSVGQKVVIIGAGLIGLELTEFLARRGRRVHLLEPSRRLAMPAGQKRRGVHTSQLDRLGVPINTGVEIQEITNDGVLLSLQSGSQKLVAADTIFVVGHPEPNPDSLEPFAHLAETVHAVGDNTGFGLSKKALTDALEIAYAL